MLYKEQTRCEEAEPLSVEAVIDRHLKLGDTHPHTLESWNNLINLYEAWNKTEKANEWQSKLLQGDDRKGKAFLYFGSFTTEDLQDKIKAQQGRVKEVEQELAEAKDELEDARKFVPSSTDFQGVFEGLLESLHRFLTLEKVHVPAKRKVRIKMGRMMRKKLNDGETSHGQAV